MSIKNGLICSTIGFALSASVCSAFFQFTNKDMLNIGEVEENDEGDVKTLTKFKSLPLKRIVDGIVLFSGVYGFYCGYKDRGSMLFK
jgi:hypothetical protein